MSILWPHKSSRSLTPFVSPSNGVWWRLIAAALVLVANLCFSADEKPGNDGSVQVTHWSFQPIRRPALPHTRWKPRNPIDHFVFDKLAKWGPAPEATRRSLIRRLYFDLIGLPPTPEEVRAFERDKSAGAYEKVVERLLASPRYGERWAQHWLDVVRFAETHGFEMNQPRSTAWLYRDYVIDSLNGDKPYDRFMVEQLAGDCLGEDAATGFLVAGPWDQVKSPDPVLTAAQRADELHDMVSTVGSALLGLTVGCARCHNHKFDPVPQTDYYAIKACLAGVQHGERKLRTPDLAVREKEARASQARLQNVEAALTEFEPIASTDRVLLVQPDPSFGSRVIQLLKPAKQISFQEGTARGEKEDPGDLGRLPNFARGCLSWSNSANTAVFACHPGITGRFQLWLSWGCGLETHANDARYVLDHDGDLTTTNDQAEVASVDQRNFSDGSERRSAKALWSGFYDAGVWDLSPSNTLLLLSGTNEGSVTAGPLAFVQQPTTQAGSELGPNSVTPIASAQGGAKTIRTSTASSKAPGTFLRAPVNARRNIERFAAVPAKRLRFTILRTSDAEPCIDELEVYAARSQATNIALATAGTKSSASSVFPNSEIHRLEHLNDGKYGNSRSWISNERSNSWVELEFNEEVTVNRVVWARDREQKFSDRLPLDYRVEVALNSNDWRLVASSQDRVPYLGGRPAAPDLSLNGLASAEASQLRKLLDDRRELEARLKELASGPMVYGGQLTEKPEPTHRLQRGDPMQKREVVEPGVLTAIALVFGYEPEREGASSAPTVALEGTTRPEAALTDDQRRRMALAHWIAAPANPLPARVIVNRLWQHHFGEGLVSTPSDFGRKGSPPSHPELLDWLAAELVMPAVQAGGTQQDLRPWSLKHIHRLIVNSAAYRQSSDSRPEPMAADAACRLLWRFPPQRLEAEPLRDAILAVSGKLDLSRGGAGFSAFETNDNYVRVYSPKKSFGPPEWRRMVYMTKVRMQQDATFGAFDCPDGGQIAPKRMRSTTPLQALNLLNSAFIIQQADFFAARLEKEAGKDIRSQAHLGFELAFNRDPDKKELSAAQALITQHGLNLFCRALFNSSEFIFVE